ncbi:MAG: PAS domain S-box protein, partial [Methylococcus sp.]
MKGDLIDFDDNPQPAAAGWRPAVIGGLTFLASAIVCAWLVAYLDSAEIEQKRARLNDLSGTYASDIQKHIERALSATYALGALVSQGRGEVPEFEAIATEMLPYYPGVAALQLAPGGVIQRVVPMAGNEGAVGHNVFSDPDQHQEAMQARDSGQLTLAGPFELKQGGFGAIGRLPVYLNDGHGTRTFWGFASALMHFPEVLQGIAFDELRAGGQAFELSRPLPGTQATQTILASNPGVLDHPVEHTISLPNGQWTLRMAPLAGWRNYPELILPAGLGVFLSTVLGLLAASRTRNTVGLLNAPEKLRIARTIETELAQRVDERTRALSAKSEELQRATERLQLAVDGTRLGIWEWTIPTRELGWTRATEDMLGHEPGYLENTLDAWLNLLPSKDREQVLAEKLAALDTTDFCELDYRLRTRDGGYRWVHDRGHVTNRDAHGHPARVIGTLQDISERKEAELALRESELRYRALTASLEDKVQERTAELEAASAAKSRFLGHMSHELRTPMNGLLGFTQLLAQEPLSSSQAAMVRHIGEAGDALLRMIDNILDLSQIEAGEIVFDRRPFEPARLFREIDHRFRHVAERKGLTWTVDANTEALPAVAGDPHRLGQVLINLVDNAIKFTAEGSVCLTARPLTIDDQTVRLRVEVRDTGIGISAETLGRLFQPFTQGDDSVNRRFDGAGLGLALGKRLIERMDGALGVSSQEGQGSTFWFEIPLQRLEAKATPAVAGPTETQSAPLPLSGLRVLVADDKAINLVVAVKILQRQGAQVVTAVDGQE